MAQISSDLIQQIMQLFGDKIPGLAEYLSGIQERGTGLQNFGGQDLRNMRIRGFSGGPGGNIGYSRTRLGYLPDAYLDMTPQQQTDFMRKEQEYMDEAMAPWATAEMMDKMNPAIGPDYSGPTKEQLALSEAMMRDQFNARLAFAKANPAAGWYDGPTNWEEAKKFGMQK